jgi:holo-[acyl-carrier protein] synthase
LLEKFGVGIDVVGVDRFSSKQFSENEDFYRKIFTDSEIQYCLKFKNPYPHFAGKFALKEAVIKALKEKIDLLEIETFHENGKPLVKLTNFPNHSSICSISHENNVGVAVFLIENHTL